MVSTLFDFFSWYSVLIEQRRLASTISLNERYTRSVFILLVVFIIYNKKEPNIIFLKSIRVFQNLSLPYFRGGPTGTIKYFVFADRGGVILLKNKEQKEQEFLQTTKTRF